MKKILIAGLFASICAAPAFADWYDGGTLHRANGQQWQAATGGNRLATSADFAAHIIGQSRVKKLGNFDKVRPYATDMRACIDNSLSGVSASVARNQQVAELAAACSILLESSWNRTLPR